MAKRATHRNTRDFSGDHEGAGKKSNPTFPVKKSRARKSDPDLRIVDNARPYREQASKFRTPLVCKTKAQTNYKQKIQSSTITIADGPAGTGKTHVALKCAAEMIDNGDIERIIVTRPAVGVDEDLGAIPGDLDMKTEPWFQPLLDILYKHWGRCHVEGMIASKKIMFVPMGHLRGRTFDNCFIIVDEAQNTTVKQMSAILTRFGSFSKVVVDGDVEQIDIQKPSGLVDALRRFKNTPGISIAKFEVSDIVRHDLIKDIILAYRSPLPAE